MAQWYRLAEHTVPIAERGSVLTNRQHLAIITTVTLTFSGHAHYRLHIHNHAGMHRWLTLIFTIIMSVAKIVHWLIATPLFIGIANHKCIFA